jgi:hypothetical protein
MATPDESVRDMEQVRHTLETVQREVPSSRYASETQASSVQLVTPLYKLGGKPNTELHMGGGHSDAQRLSGINGDYRAERSSEQFHMKIIDPRVNSNAHIPAQTGSLPNYGKKIVNDFPSQHGKRSLIKLDPLEQRRVRSVESRPITTSTYLTESLDRHREMEASKLREFLKASEDDANKPWNKPAWPGPKANDDTGESLREIEQIRKKIESLQKAAQEPKKHDDLDELARKNQELAERSKNRRHDYKLVGSDIIKTDPEPLPTHFKEQIREMLESRISTDTSSINQQDRSGYVTVRKLLLLMPAAVSNILLAYQLSVSIFKRKKNLPTKYFWNDCFFVIIVFLLFLQLFFPYQLFFSFSEWQKLFQLLFSFYRMLHRQLGNLTIRSVHDQWFL